MNDSGDTTFSSSPSVSVISSRSIACSPARPIVVLVGLVAQHVAEQLARLHRRAGLDVELRERERGLAVARIELHGLLVRRDRLGELLHLDVALAEALVRGRIVRALRERLLLPLDRLVVLARLGLDLGDLLVDLALAARHRRGELEQRARPPRRTCARMRYAFTRSSDGVLIVGHQRDELLERLARLVLLRLARAAVRLDEEVPGLDRVGIGSSLRSTRCIALIHFALCSVSWRFMPCLPSDRDDVAAAIAAREPVGRLVAEQRHDLLPVGERLRRTPSSPRAAPRGPCRTRGSSASSLIASLKLVSASE